MYGLEEFTVRVKDHDQDITHVVKQWAKTQQEANQIVYKLLVDSISGDLELL